ncbi:histidinol-phosphatase [Rhizobium sp. L1K21]|uniref:histidinol-phosphatase n=1 Tax=Rhizobium sp. L1K21 TaxID=2954933 RepID=UPI0020926389|nr:histidinol-phosphatase [Rhizobium sp. L1K21]MCO6185001.1 histidinol-phosphatase [Rhizobium sp. L1K21]
MLPPRSFFERLADAAAAETLPRFRVGADVVNKEASGFDPVTEGDRAAETAIRRLISQTYPDHGILGEEHGSVGLDRDLVWVIDPIDGTRAFISGLPVWGTLIGLYRNGRAVAGLIDQPFTRERYYADESGAYYSGPDGSRTIKSRSCGDIANATLFTTSPHIFEGRDSEQYRAVESRVRLFRYGCDCYAYALLAGGHIDLVIENNLKPYDVGAIIPIIEQSGGVMTTWQGERPEMGGQIIAAATPELHQQALALLNAA